MKYLFVLVIMLQTLSPSFIVASTIEVTTSEGKKVILSSDGTWKYAKSIPDSQPKQGFTKSSSATEVIKSQKGFLEVWFNPKKWRLSPRNDQSVGEFTLKHVSEEGYASDGYAMALTERISVPLSSLRTIALQNLRNVASDTELVLEEERVINGTKIIMMQIKSTIQGVPFMYYGYYWAGDAWSMQLVTYTGQNLFREMSADFTDLLNGVVITKK